MITPTIRYYTSTNDLFENNILTLLSHIDNSRKAFNLVFFGCSEIKDYMYKLNFIKSQVRDTFPEFTPLTGFVIQPLETQQMMGLEVHYLPENISTDILHFKKFDNIDYLIINESDGKVLVLESAISDNIYESIQVQSDSIFDKLKMIFSLEEIPIQNIVRQWNYIGNITSVTNEIQHYQAFNDSRSRFYSQVVWSNGYPAATGISMSIDIVLVSVVAISEKSELQVVSIDNSLQKPAHKYSNSVLVGSDLKTTPKFERAKIILKNQTGLCYISGTAAIRGEQSLNELDATLQTKQTVENILYLLSQKNLEFNKFKYKLEFMIESIRVYIKNASDFEAIKMEVERVWKDKPVIFTFASICRDELLVEIEGIAKLKVLLN